MGAEILIPVGFFTFWWVNDFWLKRHRARAVRQLPQDLQDYVGPAPYYRPRKHEQQPEALMRYVRRYQLSRVLGFAPLALLLIIGLIRTLTERNML